MDGMVRIIYVSSSVFPQSDLVGLSYLVTSALLVSHGIRRDTVFVYGPVGKGSRYLVVYGDSVRNLRPDVESALPLILKALKGRTKWGIVLRTEVSFKVDSVLVYGAHGLELEESVRRVCRVRDVGFAIADISDVDEVFRYDSLINATLTPNVYDFCQVITIFHYLLDYYHSS